MYKVQSTPNNFFNLVKRNGFSEVQFHAVKNLEALIVGTWGFLEGWKKKAGGGLFGQKVEDMHVFC